MIEGGSVMNEDIKKPVEIKEEELESVSGGTDVNVYQCPKCKRKIPYVLKVPEGCPACGTLPLTGIVYS